LDVIIRGRETSRPGRIGNSGTDDKGTGEETTIIGIIINGRAREYVD
jgi:hypothetical protein